MTILPCNPSICRYFSALAAVLSATVVFAAFSVFADDAHTDRNQNDIDRKIHITSDSLITDNEIKSAEFIGNVRAHQGPNIITSQRLKLYFKDTLNNVASQVSGEESINKIIATGNVIIHFDDKVAKAQKAVYITDTRILVLTGADSKITSGDDSISGEKITLFRASGRINVESGADKRVEAVFFSGEKGLN